MLEYRQTLRTISRMGLGFFAGRCISQLIGFDSQLHTAALSITSGLSLAYLEYCAQDPDHRDCTKLKTLYNFLESFVCKGSFLAYTVATTNLAFLIKGNDISYSTALAAVTLLSGIVCDQLANQITEDGRLVINNRRPAN